MVCCILIVQSCTTETKANETKLNKVNTNEVKESNSTKPDLDAKSNKGKVIDLNSAASNYTTKNTSTKTLKNTQKNTSKKTLKWYSIEQLEKLQANEPKKVIVDVYTNWCRWCKVMDQKTFTDATLIEYLNENYYMVKFNAEIKTDVTFKGKKYNYISKGRGGYNTLAAELVKGRLSYPSFVVLDEGLNHLKITQGYKNAPQFKEALESINAI